MQPFAKAYLFLIWEIALFYTLIAVVAIGHAVGQVPSTNSNLPPTQGSQAQILETGSKSQVEAVGTQTVIVSVVVAVGAVIGPLLMAWLTNRNARQIRESDYARQDVVADRAATAALKIEAFHKNQAVVSASIEGKLEVIHTLTNSAMTSAIQRELDALVAQALLMEEVVELRIKSGQTPKPQILDAVEQIKDKIVVLHKTLEERAKQDALVKSQLEAQKATADRKALEESRKPAESA